MEEHHKTSGKRLQATLLVLTILLTVATFCHLSLRPKAPLILEAMTTPSPAEGFRLNLNTATQEELECLPGIGPALAQRIRQWQTENGPFTGPEDVLSVYGIGETTYQKIEPYITFG